MYSKQLQYTLKKLLTQQAIAVTAQRADITLSVQRHRTHPLQPSSFIENRPAEQLSRFSAVISSLAGGCGKNAKRNFSTSSRVSSTVLIWRETSKCFKTHSSSKTTVSFIPQSSDSVVGETVGRRGFVSRKTYPFCEIKEEDLEEDFVRGSGPGGQSVNQTANCVVLKHKPSGIVVKCHETRSLQINRQRARERLKEKLDFHLHGSKSFLAQQEQELSLQRKVKKNRNKSRLEMKKAFKEREGIE